MNGKKDHPEDRAPNRSYCDRLAELAFPATVRVNGEANTVRVYDKESLRQAMASDEALLHRMARRYFMGTKDLTLDAVLDKAFPEHILLLGKSYTPAELRSKLPESPKLQHAVAVYTHFTPNKWLLEQELHARLDWRDELLNSTPLGWACRWGRENLVRLFLERGADPVESDAEAWATPRAWAAKKKHLGVLAILEP